MSTYFYDMIWHHQGTLLFDVLLSEKVKEQLEHDLHESQTNNAEVKRLEGEIANYKTQLTGVQKELSKEQAKTRSVSKQSQVRD